MEREHSYGSGTLVFHCLHAFQECLHFGFLPRTLLLLALLFLLLALLEFCQLRLEQLQGVLFLVGRSSSNASELHSIVTVFVVVASFLGLPQLAATAAAGAWAAVGSPLGRGRFNDVLEHETKHPHDRRHCREDGEHQLSVGLRVGPRRPTSEALTRVGRKGLVQCSRVWIGPNASRVVLRVACPALARAVQSSHLAYGSS
jgi:hypothetical protein